MAGGGGGGGGKRSANAELNLVPYIDLLSVLICFLLITAVWQQIDALSTEGNNNAASDSASPPDPNRVDLSLSIFQDRVEAAAGKNMVPIAHLAGAEPNRKEILKILASWKKQWPDRKDVTINTDSQAPYKNLITVMDTLIEGEFEDVGVNTQ
jgi:biopolymer transport protein TolR